MSNIENPILNTATAGFLPTWAKTTGSSSQVVNAPVVNGVDTNGNPIFGAPFFLTGLELQYVNTMALRLLTGVWAAGTPWRTFGFDTFNSLPYMDFSPNVVGLNGLDKDYRGAGSAPFFTNGWYYGYLLGKHLAPWNDTRVILSKEISITGVRANLVANVPAASAYSYTRKMVYAVYWDSALGAGGDFRLYNMHGGYPLPAYSYTGADCTSSFLIASVAGAVTDHTVDCSTWVPDNGRFAEVVMELVSTGGGGTAYLRTPGVPGTGDQLAVEPTATVPTYLTTTMITRSDRVLFATVPVNTTLNIYARGFGQREMT